MPYKNPEDKKRKNKEDYQKNKLRILKQQKEYASNNKELRKVQARKRRSKDGFREREYSLALEWKRNNPEKVLAQSSARRGRVRGLTPEMNKAELVEIESMYMYNHIMPGDWHVDHIKPLAAGGLHHPSNLQVLSKFDNLTKGAKWNI